MNTEEFKVSLKEKNPPAGIGANLQALWLDAKGQWHEAHNIVQETSGFEGDWIHAYLHRKEGDLSNASYWYAKVGKKRPQLSINEEWEQILSHLIKLPHKFQK
jgi:hypothetical protein